MKIFTAIAACGIGIAQTAVAQAPVTAPAQGGVRVISTTTTDDREDTLVFFSNAAPIMPFGGRVDILAGMGTVPGEVVTDKPYSADAVTESTQMLADGNRITQRNETHIYRDEQGRTRREQTLDGLGVWQAANEPATTITIHDPVAATTYMLDPRAETAHALRPFNLATGVHVAAGAASGTAASIVDVAPVPASLPPLPPAGAGVAVRDFNVAIGPGAAFPPMAAMPFALGAPGEVTTEDLGEQILEGVLARGSRETRTIPAGAIGNEQPIDIVMERWYSDALEADVLRRNIDPRFGETLYQLVNVVLGEPSADLFVVPESYELLTEENARFEFKLQRPEAGSVEAP